MTEDQIERRVEALIDRVDNLYMGSHISQMEYSRRLFEINKWAERMYEEQSK